MIKFLAAILLAFGSVAWVKPTEQGGIVLLLVLVFVAVFLLLLVIEKVGKFLWRLSSK